MSAEELNKRQRDMHYIPGFRDAPEWATWVQFCTLRGWVFYNKCPHVFSDGVASIQVDAHGYDGLKWIEAIKTDNVVFLLNKRNYSGNSKTFDD